VPDAKSYPQLSQNTSSSVRETEQFGQVSPSDSAVFLELSAASTEVVPAWPDSVLSPADAAASLMASPHTEQKSSHVES